MKWTEAEQLGYSFTGSAWTTWDTKRDEQAKAFAAGIKKTFIGADYKIVTGTKTDWLGNGSKAIMGNEVYLAVQYFDQKQEEAAIAAHEDQIAALQKEHEAELDALKKSQELRLKKYTEILKLKRK